MLKNDNPINIKVAAFIDDLFSGVGPSQQLFDLKEEIATNIKEKISDYRSRGMDDDHAFKEAIISMGDLSGLIDDMSKLGQDTARQDIYSNMTNRISTAGIVAGVLLVLFGILTTAMLYFMTSAEVEVTGSLIFVVAGGALMTYSLLTRETKYKYGMNKIRASLYALSIGLILFSGFVSLTSYYATGETFIAIASLMVFLMAGVGMFLLLILTGTDRRKYI